MGGLERAASVRTTTSNGGVKRHAVYQNPERSMAGDSCRRDGLHDTTYVLAFGASQSWWRRVDIRFLFGRHAKHNDLKPRECLPDACSRALLSTSAHHTCTRTRTSTTPWLTHPLLRQLLPASLQPRPRRVCGENGSLPKAEPSASSRSRRCKEGRPRRSAK